LNYPIHLHENGVARLLGSRPVSGNDRRPVSAEPVTVITDTTLMNGGRDFASVHFENNREASSTVRADPFFIDLKVSTHLSKSTVRPESK
jgi:hypothetical protein